MLNIHERLTIKVEYVMVQALVIMRPPLVPLMPVFLLFLSVYISTLYFATVFHFVNCFRNFNQSGMHFPKIIMSNTAKKHDDKGQGSRTPKIGPKRCRILKHLIFSKYCCFCIQYTLFFK